MGKYDNLGAFLQKQRVREVRARLLIIDPVVAAIDTAYDAHKDQHVRSVDLMVASVEAVDPNTVEFKLKFAAAPFLPSVASAWSWPWLASRRSTSRSTTGTTSSFRRRAPATSATTARWTRAACPSRPARPT